MAGTLISHTGVATLCGLSMFDLTVTGQISLKLVVHVSFHQSLD